MARGKWKPDVVDETFVASDAEVLDWIESRKPEITPIFDWNTVRRVIVGWQICVPPSLEYRAPSVVGPAYCTSDPDFRASLCSAMRFEATDPYFRDGRFGVAPVAMATRKGSD